MADAIVSSIYPARMVDELSESGLDPSEMRVRPLNAAEKSTTNSPMGADGYVIPYFDMLTGKPISFYRVKLYDQAPSAAKYRQPADSQNHIYFPPRLNALLAEAEYILLTEGEKKAARAVKAGIACVGISGVDSWKSRTVVLPKDTSLSKTSAGNISAKLPAGASPGEGTETLAQGLSGLIEYAIRRDIPLIITYDTDDGIIKYEVQRAAATLGFELRYRGLPLRNIRQLVLSPRGFPTGSKVGLDDYLEGGGTEGDRKVARDALLEQIRVVLSRKSAFPTHPNIREFFNRKLQRTQLPRSEQIAVSLVVLSDLDARGQRLRSTNTGGLFYFSQKDKSLTPVHFSGKPEFAQSPFGRHLYRDYNVSINDSRLLGWVSTQFSGEEPIADVSPERILTWRGDTLYYQINNGQMARVSKDSITVLDNGEDDVLFEADLTTAIDAQEFGAAVKVAQGTPPHNRWLEVLKATRLQDNEEGAQARLLSLLYYISPLFYRWRGTQLPVEIVTGEAGSGKSTLFTLRLNVLTGVPTLRNAPSDLRDWNASLASSGAMHITDNVQFANNELRQRLSDEICRLVTENNPTIEQRKLYSDTDLVKIPVRAVFGFTAIRQPFVNIDIIQRSIISVLDKGVDPNLKYEDHWEDHQLALYGGRINWIAHQLVMAQRMLQGIHQNWEPRYQARYRLTNVEQLLRIAAKQFGWPSNWIPEHLEKSRDKRASETDWVLEGLEAYASFVQTELAPLKWSKYRFSTSEISAWASTNPEFDQCQLLVNARSLGRYMVQHKHTIATTARIIPAGFVANKTTYKIKSEEDN